MRYYNFLFIALIFFIHGCVSETEKGEQLEYDTTDIEPVEDTVETTQPEDEDFNVLTDELADEFGKFFPSDVLLEIDKFLLAYNDMSTDKELQEVYDQGEDLFQSMFTAIAEPQTDYLLKIKKEQEQDLGYYIPVEACFEGLQKLDGKLGPIEFTCAAECTEIDFVYNQNIWLEKAKATEGSADDEFIDLFVSIYGEYDAYMGGNWPVWIMQTWDYGGSSLMGNGSLKSSIEKYIEYTSNYEGFSKELADMKSDFLNELTNQVSYWHSKEEVMKEYQEILDLKYFKGEELEIILNAKKKIDSEEGNTEFNCEDGGCTYG